MYVCSVAASIRVGNMLGADKPEVAQSAAVVAMLSEWCFGKTAGHTYLRKHGY